MVYALLILFLVAVFLLVIILVSRKQQEKKHRERVAAIARLIPDVEAALANICSLYNYSHYITESERIALDEKYAELDVEVSGVINSKELEECPQKDSFKRFHKAMSDTKGHKLANNEHFIENQLKGCAQYFDTVLAYPLDQQQREAVVSLEDNVLVISSAGSGKTMTTVGTAYDKYVVFQRYNSLALLLV